MADSMDLVQQRVEEQLQRHIHNARIRKVGASSLECVSCGIVIPKNAGPPCRGCDLCVTCQEIAELKGKTLQRRRCMSTILNGREIKPLLCRKLIKHFLLAHDWLNLSRVSCAVMMATDYPHYLVADINADLINMYQVIKDEVEHFIAISKALFACNNFSEQYYVIREEFNHLHSLDLIWKAVISFF